MKIKDQKHGGEGIVDIGARSGRREGLGQQGRFPERWHAWSARSRRR